MGEHAKFSPSAAHRWLQCAAAAPAAAKLESPDSEYSREGTFAHKIAAGALESGKNARDYLGESDGEFSVDKDMAEHVQVYLDAVRTEAMLFGGELVVEKPVWISQDVWGTPDCLMLDADGCLHVWDLKYGRGEFVEAESNPQLLTYAVGALGGLFATADVKSVKLHIVQPRRLDAEGRAHREYSTGLDEVFAHRDAIAAAVLAATQHPDSYTPGDWCKWCPAAPTCPGLAKRTLAIAQEVFADEEQLTPTAAPDLATVPAERLATILRAASTVEAWIAAVREHALQRARREAIPGFKLVEKLSNRKWRDAEAAKKMLLACGVNPFAPPELLSPAAAERARGKKAKLSEAYTERVVTGVALVPESDRRPATSQADVFIDEK